MREIDSRTLTPVMRELVLLRDLSTCQYCGGDANSVDHIIPWSHSHSNAAFNLVAACYICNSVASNKVFDTFLEKKNHIITRRLQMLSRMAVPIWTRAEVDELGGRLRDMVMDTCVVVEKHSDGLVIAERLAKDGFRVTFGNGDEMGLEQIMAEINTTQGKLIKNSPWSCRQCGRDLPRPSGRGRERKYCDKYCSRDASRQRRISRKALPEFSK